MSNSWPIDIDKIMFDIAEERPHIWKYLFLNDYMMGGVSPLEYFPYWRTEPSENIKKLVKRFPSRNNVETYLTDVCTRYQFSNRDCRTVVINLVLILQHTVSLLETQGIDSDEIVKPEINEALLNSFVGIAARFSGLDVDGVKRTSGIKGESQDPLEQILLVFRSEKIWPEKTRSDGLLAALFTQEGGKSLESRNPCEVIQAVFRHALSELDRKEISAEDFFVPALTQTWPNMCCAQQCCRVPFRESEITYGKIDKSFLATKGIVDLKPDKPLHELAEDPLFTGPNERIARNMRGDLNLLLLCSGIDIKSAQGKVIIPLKVRSEDAFMAYPTDTTLSVPLFNYHIIEELGVAADKLQFDMPYKIGPTKRGMRYVVEQPQTQPAKRGTPDESSTVSKRQEVESFISSEEQEDQTAKDFVGSNLFWVLNFAALFLVISYSTDKRLL